MSLPAQATSTRLFITYRHFDTLQPAPATSTRHQTHINGSTRHLLLTTRLTANLINRSFTPSHSKTSTSMRHLTLTTITFSTPTTKNYHFGTTPQDQICTSTAPSTPPIASESSHTSTIQLMMTRHRGNLPHHIVMSLYAQVGIINSFFLLNANFLFLSNNNSTTTKRVHQDCRP